MDPLQIKIAAARKLVLSVLAGRRRPIILCSFGKDSMVLLHLLREMGLHDLPLLFHREPFLPRKYDFANRIIRDWNLTVYDYAPAQVAVVKNGEVMELVNYYQAGWLGDQPYYNHLPTGIVEPVAGEPFLCGKADLLEKPTGNFNFIWDLAFIGHKASDVDPIIGPMPVKVDLVQNPGGCDNAYPIRHFTDEDVWEYHKRFNVPIHADRYDETNGFQEFSDKRDNPDYFECCTRCFDRDQPAVVTCPKTGLQLTNISKRVRYVEPLKMDYYAPETK